MKVIINWLIVGFFFLSSNCFAFSVDDGIKLFNQQDYLKAKTVLRPFAREKNTRALFWLGVSQFNTDEQLLAGSTLLKAAQAGNPWAMRLMTPSLNGYCNYLGWPCDESWMAKAIVGWKILANEGDGKAMYALLRWGDKPWWSYVPIFRKKKYGDLIEKIIKSGGYSASKFAVLNTEKRIELLRYAANKNYAPAMIYLYSLLEKYPKFKKGNSLNLLGKALRLGNGGGAFTLYSYYENKLPVLNKLSVIKNLSNENKQYFKEAYYYSLISQGFGYKTYFSPSELVKTKEGEKLVCILSKEDKKIIEYKAREFLKNTKVNMFFDESTSIQGLLGS